MDRRSEALLVDRLLSQRPDDGVLGEEGAAHVGSTGVRWVLDPIDGTVNYLYGLPEWAVSVAAEIDGVVVVGVVEVPALRGDVRRRAAGAARACTTAHGGARPPRERPRAARPGARRHRVRLHASSGGSAQARVVEQVVPRVRDIRRGGACSVDLCSVAAGRVDAYYERGPMAWDLAAGRPVAAEAGARLEGLHGAPAGEDLIVAAGPTLFPELHDLLAGLRADTD